MPWNILVPSLRISAFTEMDDSAIITERLKQILELKRIDLSQASTTGAESSRKSVARQAHQDETFSAG